MATVLRAEVGGEARFLVAGCQLGQLDDALVFADADHAGAFTRRWACDPALAVVDLAAALAA